MDPTGSFAPVAAMAALSADLCVVQSRNSVTPSNSHAPEITRSAVLAVLGRAWGKTGRCDRFRGANPVSIARKDLSVVTNDILVSLKSDGVRYMLVLTMVDGEPVAVMVDRRMRMYEVEIWANNTYYMDTVIDGELVFEHGYTVPKLVFLMFDCLMMEGATCNGVRYCDRLMKLHAIVFTPIEGETLESIEQRTLDENKLVCMNTQVPLRLEPKRFVPRDQVCALWDTRHASCHKNDGLIIALNTDRVGTGSCRDVFKWKPDNTIDVRICLPADTTDASTVQVYVALNGKTLEITKSLEYNGRKLRVAMESNDLITRTAEASRRSNSALDAIFECRCTLKDEWICFFPMKHRPDKPSANDLFTVQATITNVIENITIEEIMSYTNARR